MPRPDVRVIARGDAPRSAGEGGLMLDAPYTLVAELDPVTERFIRILDADGERLITVIECLSPSNKSGEGLHEYRRKRTGLLDGGVHVVELDPPCLRAFLLTTSTPPADPGRSWREDALEGSTPARPASGDL